MYITIQLQCFAKHLHSGECSFNTALCLSFQNEELTSQNLLFIKIMSIAPNLIFQWQKLLKKDLVGSPMNQPDNIFLFNHLAKR